MKTANEINKQTGRIHHRWIVRKGRGCTERRWNIVSNWQGKAACR